MKEEHFSWNSSLYDFLETVTSYRLVLYIVFIILFSYILSVYSSLRGGILMFKNLSEYYYVK